ncbi:MAG: hypothetical protein ACYTG7_11105 [Planctomycetota bacterium]|jgi:hypothetical protein
MRKRNVYVPILTGLFIFLALYGLIGFWALDHFHAQDPPASLTLACVAVFFLGLIALFVCIFLYIRKEERIVRGVFLDFARELSADQEALNPFQEPQYGRRRFPGIWAQAEVRHKDRAFILFAENVPNPRGRACIPFFLVKAKEEETMSRDGGDELHRSLKAHPLLKQLQRDVKKTGYVIHEHGPAIRLPIKSEVTPAHLRTAMEILIR